MTRPRDAAAGTRVSERDLSLLLTGRPTPGYGPVCDLAHDLRDARAALAALRAQNERLREALTAVRGCRNNAATPCRHDPAHTRWEMADGGKTHYGICEDCEAESNRAWGLVDAALASTDTGESRDG